MATDTDTKRVYSSIYDKCDAKKENCRMKLVTVAGEYGKKISIQELSLSDSIAALGANGTATVTAQAGGGEEKLLATFTSSSTKYTEKKQVVDYTAEAGKSVILRWYLITSDPKVRARIKFCSYTYSMLSSGDSEDPKTGACLLIPCASETDANALKDAIKNEVPYIDIYIKSEI